MGPIESMTLHTPRTPFDRSPAEKGFPTFQPEDISSSAAVLMIALKALETKENLSDSLGKIQDGVFSKQLGLGV